MYRHSKSVFLQVNFKFELEQMNISSGHSGGARHDSGSGIIFHKKSIGLDVILYPRLLKF